MHTHIKYWTTIKDLKKYVSRNDYKEFTEMFPMISEVVIYQDGEGIDRKLAPVTMGNNEYFMIDNGIIVRW